MSAACSWASCQNCGRCTAPWEREDEDTEPDAPESPVDHAAQAVLSAVTDFHLAIEQARTVETARQLHDLIGTVWIEVDAAERAARLRADELCVKE